MSGISDRRHQGPKSNVGELFALLDRLRWHQTAADVASLPVLVEVETGVERRALELDLRDLPVYVAHVEAPERPVRTAEETRVAPLLGKEQPRALVAAGREHDSGSGHLAVPAVLQVERHRRHPAGVPHEAGYGRSKRYEEVFARGQRVAVQDLDPRHVAPTLEQLEAKGVVGRDLRQRLAPDRGAGAEHRAGRRRLRHEIARRDRPCLEAEPRPGAEIDRVER